MEPKLIYRLTQLWLLCYLSMSKSVTAQALFPSVLSLTDLNSTTGFRIDGEAVRGYSGYSVASAGDINGDGMDDLIIGAPYADTNGLQDAGSTYVIYGLPGGLAHPFPLASLTNATGFRLDGEAAEDFSGWSVASAGDFNDDGIGDLIIGATSTDPNGQDRAGSSYVIYGQPGGLAHPFSLASLTSATGFRIDGVTRYDSVGRSVASAGDINADGVDDIIIGAFAADPNGLSDAGSSYVIYGQPGGLAHPFSLASLTKSTGFRIDGEAARDYCGFSIASAGDVNGDSMDDLVIGARQAGPNGLVYAGSSYVVYGQPGGLAHPFMLASLTKSTGFRIDGEAAGDYSGQSVGNAGDINGDGMDDLFISAAQTAPNGLANAGSSYVIYGQPGGLPHPFSLANLTQSTGFRIDGEMENDLSGWSVASAGDINGDDVGDLIIGAIEASPNGKVRAGSSYVIYGKPGGLAHPLSLTGLTKTTGFRIDGEAVNNKCGVSVASAGDINGDGMDDLFIGAYTASPDGQAQLAGSSYVIYGRRQDASQSPSSSTVFISQTTASTSSHIAATTQPSSDAPGTTTNLNNMSPTASNTGATDSLSSSASAASQTTASTSSRITATTQPLLSMPSSDVPGTTKRRISASDSSNTIVLVGSIVGGVALASSLAAVGLFACRKKAAKQPNSEQQASSEMTSVASTRTGHYASMSDMQTLQAAVADARASKVRDAQPGQQGYQDFSSVRDSSHYASFTDFPPAASPYLSSEATTQVLQAGAEYARASKLASANPSNNIYDVIGVNKPAQYSHYANSINIPQPSSHYLEGDEARIVMDALAQNLPAVEAQARHDGYDDITQVTPTK